MRHLQLKARDLGLNLVLDRMAAVISAIFNPYNTAFVLLVIASLVSMDELVLRLAWISFSLTVFGILPRLILRHLAATQEIGDLDVSVRLQRIRPRIVTLSMLVVSLPICLAKLSATSLLLQRACIIFPILVTLGYLCSHLWKVSGHVSSMMALVTFLYLVCATHVGILVALVLVVAWTRIRLRAHNVWETFLGAALGTLSTLTAWHM